MFESFDQEEDFFHGHQGNYLTDISRVLTYTGKRYNFYDVMVMALDPVVSTGTDCYCPCQNSDA